MVQLCRMPQACNRPTTHLRTINMCKIFSPGTWQNHIQFHSLLKYSLHRLLKRTSSPHKGINFFISSSEKGINQTNNNSFVCHFSKRKLYFSLSTQWKFVTKNGIFIDFGYNCLSDLKHVFKSYNNF